MATILGMVESLADPRTLEPCCIGAASRVHLIGRPQMLELGRWADQAKKHWQTYQPTRYAQLVADGTLDKEAHAAAKLTAAEIDSLRAQGLDEQGAWERARELYLFPPEEENEDEEKMPRCLA